MLIKLVTFNIHHGTNINNEPSLSEIIDLLKNINPDIVCLQEVDMLRPKTDSAKQAIILAKSLGMRYLYEPVRIYDKGSYGNAILSRYPIITSQNIRLDDDKDVRYCLQVDIRVNNHLISVFNTHLGLSGPTRYYHLKEIILPKILLLNHPAILAGDFNAPPNRPEIIMLNSFLTDTYQKNTGIYHYTFPANKPNARIDYIFINNHIIPLDYYIVDADVSDHLPVISLLQL